MHQWRLISDAAQTGSYNMAIDEAIMRTVAQGRQPPTLRLYRWEPMCLSLGYGQRVRDADREQIAANGWHMVRRPTGGRAILHGDELTYSVSLADSHPMAKGGIIDTYLRLSQGLLLAMVKLGLTVSADPDGDTQSTKGAVCFEVPSRYEITINHKKLIGSAQLRRHGGVLQHGTIPIHGDIARICDALCYTTAHEREAAKQQVRERAATLANAGLTDITWNDVAQALVVAFAEALEIELREDTLSDEEQALADDLHHTVYTQDAWNLKR